MLDYIEQITTDAGCGPVDTILSEWESAEPPVCDLAFAYNCFYRMKHIEDNLLKLDRSARKLCVIGMNRSPEQPYLPILEHELGLAVRYTRMDYHQIWDILGELGITAQMIEIPNVRDYHYDSFEAVFDRAVQYIEGPYDPQAVREVLLRYHTALDGGYTCRYLFVSGLLYWQPANG